MLKPSPEEVEELARFFSSQVVLPEELLETSRRSWEGSSVLCRSLGRRVPVEWVASEVRLRAKLAYAPEGFTLAEDILVLRFRSDVDCQRILEGGPWLVAEQLLAMEPWVPDFIPGSSALRRATVWLRLPGLPLEYWTPAALQEIVASAGRPLAVDSFTETGKKAGFARIRVEIDVGHPLQPGVLIKGREAPFWQPFVYEGIPEFCFSCGRLGHAEEKCRAGEASSAPSGGAEQEAARRPRLGPWLVTQRLWQSKPSAPSPASAGGGPFPSSASAAASGPPSSSSQPDPPPPPKPMVFSAVGEWQVPARVARRRLPAHWATTLAAAATPASGSGAGRFGPLAVVDQGASGGSSVGSAGRAKARAGGRPRGSRVRALGQPLAGPVLALGSGADGGPGVVALSGGASPRATEMILDRAGPQKRPRSPGQRALGGDPLALVKSARSTQVQPGPSRVVRACSGPDPHVVCELPSEVDSSRRGQVAAVELGPQCLQLEVDGPPGFVVDAGPPEGEPPGCLGPAPGQGTGGDGRAQQMAGVGPPPGRSEGGEAGSAPPSSLVHAVAVGRLLSALDGLGELEQQDRVLSLEAGQGSGSSDPVP